MANTQSATRRNKKYVPQEVRDGSHIVAAIQALFAYKPDAREECELIQNQVRPDLQDMKSEGEAIFPRVPEALPGTTRNSDLAAADKSVRLFCERWLFGSEYARDVLWSLFTIGVTVGDFGAFDRQRYESSELWQAVYGGHTTRPSRRRRKEVLGQLKALGWRRLDDEALYETAKNWIDLHHNWGGRLSDWLQDRDKAKPAAEDLVKWSLRFKPFDVALGRPRKRFSRPEKSV